jgi:hypothetical protein
MENLLPEFEPYKEKIPEFVIKLYHILEVPSLLVRRRSTRSTCAGTGPAKF